MRVIEQAKERQVHHLKTMEPFFGETAAGNKPWEIRNDDRSFKVGDIVVLQEMSTPASPAFRYERTGRTLTKRIGYVMRPGWDERVSGRNFEQFGLREGFVIFTLEDIEEGDE